MNTNTLTKIVFALAALASPACAQTYGSAPPLTFGELPYASPSGERWPEKSIQLEVIAESYGLAVAPKLADVDLNAEAERTIVLLHGLGSYLKFWRAQIDALSERGFRVIAVDMLGYGKSDKPASFPYTTEAMADVVHELVGALSLDRPILAGHSMGGQIALSYAIRFPGDVSALVLASPAGFESFSKKEKAWFQAAYTSSLITQATEEAIWGNVRRANFSRWTPELEWLIEERVRVSKVPEFDQYAYANVLSVRGLAHNDFVKNNLDKVSVPTLIVYGEDDRLIPNPFMHPGPTRAIMERGHRAIAGSELVGLARCGHTVQLDCAEEYNDAVLRFLSHLPEDAEHEREPIAKKAPNKRRR